MVSLGNFGDECIFLLGAGASANANVPISVGLNKNIYDRIDESSTEGSKQKRLVNYILGSVYFYRGLNNKNPGRAPVNMEEVVSALRQIRRRDEAFVSAFVGSWHEKIRSFSEEFLQRFEDDLTQWIAQELDHGADHETEYLQWFAKLREEHSTNLNIFTLNHDLTVETALDTYGVNYCTGFDFKENGEGKWDPGLFDSGIGRVPINLYKLHGSLGWIKDEDTQEVTASKVHYPADPHLMIFGMLEKVTVEEPFFELVKRFKELSRNASLIVVLGYSFNDEHVNSILFDSLRVESGKRLLIVDLRPDKILQRLEDEYAADINFSLIETLGKGHEMQDLFETSVLEEKIEELMEELAETPF
jgi:hypothetical protein